MGWSSQLPSGRTTCRQPHLRPFHGSSPRLVDCAAVAQNELVAVSEMSTLQLLHTWAG